MIGVEKRRVTTGGEYNFQKGGGDKYSFRTNLDPLQGCGILLLPEYLAGCGVKLVHTKPCKDYYVLGDIMNMLGVLEYWVARGTSGVARMALCCAG
jgi:hypothetical protein